MQLTAHGNGITMPMRKIWLLMRITTLLLLGACLQVSARSSGQTVSLSGRNLSLEKVFKEIRQQTGYSFFYQDELLRLASPVDIDVKGVPLAQALDACFKGQPLTYTIIDKAIFVRKRDIEAPPPPVDVHGRVVDSTGRPVVGATVQARAGKQMTETDENGEFTLKGLELAETIEVSSVGFQTQTQRLDGRITLLFRLQAKVNNLQEINVTVNTGYQALNLGRATGSYVKIDEELFNRSVSSDVLDRLNGITSGLLTTPVGLNNTSGNQLGINIRGLSTINSGTQPLIVIDNFPYDGDLNNINPNDVESVTVLKDAAAASIWGVRAGNGVIVITTKKGSYGQAPRLSFNANATWTEKPNLFYNPSMSSSDYIDMESYLYGQGFYNGRVDDNYYWTPLDPVQEILTQQATGQISSGEATTQINALRNYDIRNDVSKYLYQGDVNQQYALSITGGSVNDQYFLSGGFDNNDGNNSFMKGNAYRRVTLNANNTIAFLNHRLEVSTQVYYINSSTANNGVYVNMPFPYPYARLADASGNPLPIAQYRQGFLDTAGGGLLLDWNYRPLQELNNADNVTNENEYRINLGIRYHLPVHLTADIKYQYGSMSTNNQNLQNLQSYYTRNLINQFSQIDWATGTVTYPVPLGDILNVSQSTYTFQNFRGQLSYADKWSQKHQLSALVGTEVRDAETTGQSFIYYGYDPVHGTSMPVNYATYYPNYIGGYPSTIGDGQKIIGLTNRYLSYFGNADYTFMERYTLSASGRNDGANLFGVSANNQWKPLWSAGAAWEVNKEAFYHVSWLPFLKLRSTYGYQGNVAPASALLGIFYGGTNFYGAPESSISNYPNANLRWEKTGQWNGGIDFALKGGRLSGSLEYYLKKSVDLLGPEVLPPQSGIGYSGSNPFEGNAGSMKGRGVDVVLNSRNLTGKFQWTTQFLFNYNTDRVTKYDFQIYYNSSLVSAAGTTGNGYYQPNRPVQGLYSYRWAGLDSAGNPQGYLNGKVSEDYGSILYTNDPTQLKYDGHLAPQFFGGLRNTFGFKQVSLSFNITYKLGYFFRRNSVNYYNLFNMGYTWGTQDYAKRWQKPGDEKVTNVPSLIYPDNSSTRDQFYNGSEVLVDRGDHIRLQDIQLSYDLTRKQWGRLPVQGIRIYLYANNIGILWRANHDGIDPDAIPTNGSNYTIYPNPRSIAAGIKIDL
jgi:TonB-linked SusC/RagA family outer membrane protein